MAVFEASPEGFRSQNLGRPASHLVRELLQNSLDEWANVEIDVRWTPKKGVRVRVADDLPGGIREERLIFTIWESDKQDSPLKRGRMGRGLKEVVSVSDWTSVATQDRPTTLFERSAEGEWSRKSTRTIPSPARGTVVEAQVRAWGKKDAEAIVAYLRSVRPPEGVRLVVCGEVVERRRSLEEHLLWLPSVTYAVADGERRVSNRAFLARVDLFAEAPARVYEMGLPIEEIDFPFSIDVGQRVPLREQRDTLTAPYRSELFAKLLDARIALVPAEQLRDNYVLKAAEYKCYLSDAAKRKIAGAWTEGRPYASTPAAMSAATGQHVEVVNLRTLPEAVRAIVSEVGKNVQEVLEERHGELCPRVEPTAEQARLVRCWERIALAIGRPCEVVLAGGRPSAEASFQRATRVLTIYRDVVGADWFASPLGTDQLALLIHELSHWERRDDEHGLAFHSDAEHVGAEIASLLYLMPEVVDLDDDRVDRREGGPS